MTCDLQDKIYKNFVTYVFCLTFAYQRRFVLIATAERWYLLAVETFFGVILTYFDGKDTTDFVCIKETITNSFRNRFATLVLKLPLKEPNNVFGSFAFSLFFGVANIFHSVNSYLLSFRFFHIPVLLCWWSV